MYSQLTDLLQAARPVRRRRFRALAARYPAMRYIYETHHVRALLHRAHLAAARWGGRAHCWPRPSRPRFGPDDLATVQAPGAPDCAGPRKPVCLRAD
ncbi:MAG: hypothetical protein WKG07_23570 [Hymenobacter sp.]